MTTAEANPIRCDAATLEERARLFPVELREGFLWLGEFLREECHRDLATLAERARAVGIVTDKANWARILRGQWNRDARGNEIAPCVASEKLLKFIELLQRDARLKEQGGRIPFVETGTARLIFDFVDLKRAPERVCKFGIVIGETGTQKTAAFREYARRNNHGACVWLDAPETPSMARFKSDLARCYGAPAGASLARKEQRIAETMNARRTIILENVQRLYLEKEEGNQPVFNYLQKLQELTGCTVILSFTPTFERKFTAGLHRGFFEQFVGRAGGASRFLRLPEFPPEDDVAAIASAFKFKGLNESTTWPTSGKPEKMSALEYLTRIAQEPGRVRRLFEDLQDAKLEAEAGRKPLTIAQVKFVRQED